MLGEHAIQSVSPKDDILRYLEQTEGLTGEAAQERIKYMRQTMARQQARAAGDREPFGLGNVSPGEGLKRLFGQPVEDGKVTAFRARVSLSFKYET